MIIWLATFAVLVGITAAVLVISAGAGPLVAFLAYSLGGSLGLLTVAMSYYFTTAD